MAQNEDCFEEVRTESNTHKGSLCETDFLALSAVRWCQWNAQKKITCANPRVKCTTPRVYAQRAVTRESERDRNIENNFDCSGGGGRRGGGVILRTSVEMMKPSWDRRLWWERKGGALTHEQWRRGSSVWTRNGLLSCPTWRDQIQKKVHPWNVPGRISGTIREVALRLLHPEDIAHLCFLRQNTSSRWVHVRVCVW